MCLWKQTALYNAHIRMVGRWFTSDISRPVGHALVHLGSLRVLVYIPQIRKMVGMDWGPWTSQLKLKDEFLRGKLQVAMVWGGATLEMPLSTQPRMFDNNFSEEMEIAACRHQWAGMYCSFRLVGFSGAYIVMAADLFLRNQPRPRPTPTFFWRETLMTHDQDSYKYYLGLLVS